MSKQVICINDKEWGDVCDCPREGEVCTVKRAFFDDKTGDDDSCYELEGYDGWYSQKYFADKENLEETHQSLATETT